ncbi:vitamin K epoxide reductase family protein [Candidatus Uhrbacteria bacterium]|nr:vitamin K epoxide reductase family protein [Candidatus Uhrbacteria bacterium]
MRRLLLGIAVLSVLGVVVSGYALRQHYAPVGSGSFCNLSTTLSCDLVNQSSYSEILGIPVAGIGIAGYLAMLVLSVVAMGGVARAKRCLPWLQIGAMGGIGFSLVLTAIEIFVIGAICILCVASQVLILAIGGCVLALTMALRRTSPSA